MGLLQLPVDPPVPEGCLSLEAALQAGGVAQFILSSALPPTPPPPRCVAACRFANSRRRCFALY